MISYILIIISIVSFVSFLIFWWIGVGNNRRFISYLKEQGRMIDWMEAVQRVREGKGMFVKGPAENRLWWVSHDSFERRKSFEMEYRSFVDEETIWLLCMEDCGLLVENRPCRKIKDALTMAGVTDKLVVVNAVLFRD